MPLLLFRAHRPPTTSRNFPLCNTRSARTQSYDFCDRRNTRNGKHFGCATATQEIKGVARRRTTVEERREGRVERGTRGGRRIARFVRNPQIPCPIKYIRPAASPNCLCNTPLKGTNRLASPRIAVNRKGQMTCPPVQRPRENNTSQACCTVRLAASRRRWAK
jgi:hypothetical protein